MDIDDIDNNDDVWTEADYATWCAAANSILLPNPRSPPPPSVSTTPPPPPFLKAAEIMKARVKALKSLASFNTGLLSVILLGFTLSVFTAKSSISKDHWDVGLMKFSAIVVLAVVALTLYHLSAALALSVAWSMGIYENELDNEEFITEYMNRKVFFWKTRISLLASLLATIAFVVNFVFTIETKIGVFPCQPWFVKFVIIFASIILGITSLVYLEPVVAAFNIKTKPNTA